MTDIEKQLQEKIDEAANNKAALMNVSGEITELKRKLDVAVETLEFYEIGWVKKHSRIDDFGVPREVNKNPAVFEDAGKRARQALKQIRGETK